MLPLIIAARLIVAITLATATEHELVSKVVRISDGDTIAVLDSQNEQHKIRLYGIDAPEKSQAFGTKAKEALGSKVHEKMVRVVWKERDRYGRIIGQVHLGNRDVNGEMVRDGFAWWYRQYAPKDKALEAAEQEARKERRGLWLDNGRNGATHDYPSMPPGCQSVEGPSRVISDPKRAILRAGARRSWVELGPWARKSE